MDSTETQACTCNFDTGEPCDICLDAFETEPREIVGEAEYVIDGMTMERFLLVTLS